MQQRATGQLDSDNDGVADHLDIDSDNDGIYDVVEGGDGAMDSDGNGMLNSSDAGYIDIDNDGAMDGSEITTVVDTDNDGTADYIDTDSDNDGCNDTKEAGFTDIEGDGILGGTPIAVDAMGKVTTSTDGYTSPADADANEVADYQEVGAEPVLDANASDVTVTENTEAVFTVAVTASNEVTYQWQMSSNGGTTWTDIVDDANYSGSTTSTLTIAEATIDMDGMMYQALITMETFACASLTTDPPVMLTVLPDGDNDGLMMKMI